MKSIWVYYCPSQYTSYDKKLDEVATKYGGKQTGGGLGFNMRDQSFNIPDECVDDFCNEIEGWEFIMSIEVKDY